MFQFQWLEVINATRFKDKRLNLLSASSGKSIVVNYFVLDVAKEKAILKDMKRCVLTRERKHLRLHRIGKAKAPIIETKRNVGIVYKTCIHEAFHVVHCVVMRLLSGGSNHINKNILIVVIFESVSS